jgi:murein DD-endopeptidase MepM/ murein hydrolase activator NlpD
MPDISVRNVGVAALLGNHAGNGIVIDHDDAWQAQYNHLQNGSVDVEPGDQIRQGQPLGLVDFSGRTEFPHLDFDVRFKGKFIDPFTGLTAPGGCDAMRAPLWRDVTRWRK